MSDEWRSGAGISNRSAKRQVAALAAQQFGRVSWAQMRDGGVAKPTIRGWLQTGYLYRVLPRVYAVGHRGNTTETDLAAALLYAGPGAMLSHATAAWWVGLATSKPYMIDVSTPRRCRSIPGIRVHPRRRLERDWHNGLPVTKFTQTLLDYATVASLSKVRLALARADYEEELSLAAIKSSLGSRPGSARVRSALKRHQPMLARARSGIELDLFEMCESARIPLPELNADVAGWTVDAVWRSQRIVVELDGPRNHRTPAQIRRDRRKDFELRALGFIVLRYSDEQITHEPEIVMAELSQLLEQRAPPA